MRLAFVTVGDTGRKVGGHLYNARLLAGLRQRGVEVGEIVASAESAEEQRAASSELGKRLSPEEFDVIVVDTLARAVCAPHLDGWRETTPVVALVHELPSVARSDERERPHEEPLLRADRLVCVSPHGASILEERGVSASRLHVVPPGLDLPAGGVPEKDSERPPRVLCVAQWIPRKNVAWLVEVWSKLREERPDLDATLELVGETDADPDYASEVREAISRTDGVVVRGAIPDGELRRAYAAASVFALPSIYEGYGMVYAEAMSYGLPVVALDTGPVPEVVGDAGMLVEPGDAAGFADALYELLSEPEQRRRLSESAIRRAGRLPDWEETVDCFLRVIEVATSGGARR